MVYSCHERSSDGKRQSTMVTPRAAILIGRVALITVQLAAFICALRATEVNFTAFMFLKVLLPVLLLCNALRLVYDAAQVFLDVPLPPQLIVFTALVLSDVVAAVMLFAAGSSATAVLVFFRIDTRACGWEMMRPAGLPGACSHWYVAAAALTWCAWFFNLVIAALIALLLVVFIHHGQD